MKCVILLWFTAMIYSLLCNCLDENLNWIRFIIVCISLKTSKNHKLWLDSLIRDFSILSIYRFLKKGRENKKKTQHFKKWNSATENKCSNIRQSVRKKPTENWNGLSNIAPEFKCSKLMYLNYWSAFDPLTCFMA